MSGPGKRETMAIAMALKLYEATGGDTEQWRSIDLIAQKAEHVEALRLALVRGWIEAAPGLHSVRLTDKGRRVANPR